MIRLKSIVYTNKDNKNCVFYDNYEKVDMKNTEAEIIFEKIRKFDIINITGFTLINELIINEAEITFSYYPKHYSLIYIINWNTENSLKTPRNLQKVKGNWYHEIQK